MKPFPKISPVTIPDQFPSPDLAGLKAALAAADLAAKTAAAWVAAAGGKVAEAGAAFSESVRGDYPDAKVATAATSKAEKALASAQRDKALLQNVLSFRTSVAQSAAAALKSRIDELEAGYVAAAAQNWREERDAVNAHFRDAVIESMVSTPMPFRSVDRPPVAPELYTGYDAALRELDAARRSLNDRGASLNELDALSPRAIIAQAITEGRFTVAAA